MILLGMFDEIVGKTVCIVASLECEHNFSLRLDFGSTSWHAVRISWLASIIGIKFILSLSEEV